jgi:aminoglycoside phosphotransferase (APT) family kinase protein
MTNGAADAPRDPRVVGPHTWTAELLVDEALARRLLRQFRELDLRSLRLLATGWDRTVWLVNETWAFGFPRREIVVPGIKRELAWLPRLAPLLPIPIPEPHFIGEPSGEFPWPFFGAAFIPGVEAWEVVPPSDTARLAVALELACFLRRLHDEEIYALAAEIPLDPNARTDMTQRVPKTRAALAQLEHLGLWQPPASVTALLDEAERLPSSRRLAICHGDLHVRQLLVADGRLSGVIDWVDLCRSDPATDLSLVWNFLHPDQRTEFLATYGEVAPDQLLRARILALNLCAVLAAYGHTERHPALAAECIAGLERAASN